MIRFRFRHPATGYDTKQHERGSPVPSLLSFASTPELSHLPSLCNTLCVDVYTLWSLSQNLTAGLCLTRLGKRGGGGPSDPSQLIKGKRVLPPGATSATLAVLTCNYTRNWISKRGSWLRLQTNAMTEKQCSHYIDLVLNLLVAPPEMNASSSIFTKFPPPPTFLQNDKKNRKKYWGTYDAKWKRKFRLRHYVAYMISPFSWFLTE